MPILPESMAAKKPDTATMQIDKAFADYISVQSCGSRTVWSVLKKRTQKGAEIPLLKILQKQKNKGSKNEISDGLDQLLKEIQKKLKLKNKPEIDDVITIIKNGKKKSRKVIRCFNKSNLKEDLLNTIGATSKFSSILTLYDAEPLDAENSFSKIKEWYNNSGKGSLPGSNLTHDQIEKFMHYFSMVRKEGSTEKECSKIIYDYIKSMDEAGFVFPQSHDSSEISLRESSLINFYHCLRKRVTSYKPNPIYTSQLNMFPFYIFNYKRGASAFATPDHQREIELLRGLFSVTAITNTEELMKLEKNSEIFKFIEDPKQINLCKIIDSISALKDIGLLDESLGSDQLARTELIQLFTDLSRTKYWAGIINYHHKTIKTLNRVCGAVADGLILSERCPIADVLDKPDLYHPPAYTFLEADLSNDTVRQKHSQTAYAKLVYLHQVFINMERLKKLIEVSKDKEPDCDFSGLIYMIPFLSEHIKDPQMKEAIKKLLSGSIKDESEDIANIKTLIEVHKAEMQSQLINLGHIEAEIDHEKLKTIFESFSNQLGFKTSKKLFVDELDKLSTEELRAQNKLAPMTTPESTQQTAADLAKKSTESQDLQYFQGEVRRFSKDILDKSGKNYHTSWSNQFGQVAKIIKDKYPKQLKENNGFKAKYREFGIDKSAFEAMYNINQLTASALEKAHEILNFDNIDVLFKEIDERQKKMSELDKSLKEGKINQQAYDKELKFLPETIIERAAESSDFFKAVREHLQHNITFLFTNVDDMGAALSNPRVAKLIAGKEKKFIEIYRSMRMIQKTGDLNCISDLELSSDEDIELLRIVLQCVMPLHTPTAYNARFLFKQYIDTLIQKPLVDDNPLHVLNLVQSQAIPSLASLAGATDVFKFKDNTLKNLSALSKALDPVEAENILQLYIQKKSEKAKAQSKRNIPSLRRIFNILFGPFIKLLSRTKPKAPDSATIKKIDTNFFTGLDKFSKHPIPHIPYDSEFSELFQSNTAKTEKNYDKHKGIILTKTNLVSGINHVTKRQHDRHRKLAADEDLSDLSQIKHTEMTDLSKASYFHMARSIKALNEITQRLSITRFDSDKMKKFADMAKKEITQSLLLGLQLKRADPLPITDDMDLDNVRRTRESLLSLFQNFSIDSLASLQISGMQKEINYVIQTIFPVEDTFSYAKVAALRDIFTLMKSNPDLPFSTLTGNARIRNKLGRYFSGINSLDSVIKNGLGQLEAIEEAMDLTLFEYAVKANKEKTTLPDNQFTLDNTDNATLEKATLLQLMANYHDKNVKLYLDSNSKVLLKKSPFGTHPKPSILDKFISSLEGSSAIKSSFTEYKKGIEKNIVQKQIEAYIESPLTQKLFLYPTIKHNTSLVHKLIEELKSTSPKEIDESADDLIAINNFIKVNFKALAHQESFQDKAIHSVKPSEDQEEVLKFAISRQKVLHTNILRKCESVSHSKKLQIYSKFLDDKEFRGEFISTLEAGMKSKEYISSDSFKPLSEALNAFTKENPKDSTKIMETFSKYQYAAGLAQARSWKGRFINYFRQDKQEPSDGSPSPSS